MIRLTAQNGMHAVDLLEQDNESQFVLQGKGTQAQHMIRLVP